MDRIDAMAQRPAKLKFYVARNRGRFEEIDTKAVADLPVINPDKNQKGFRYTSPADGEYDSPSSSSTPTGPPSRPTATWPPSGGSYSTPARRRFGWPRSGRSGSSGR